MGEIEKGADRGAAKATDGHCPPNDERFQGSHQAGATGRGPGDRFVPAADCFE